MKIHTEKLNNDVPLDMVYIPCGTFIMGSPQDEEGRFSDESPQHEVTVPAFFMGKYPVTQAQYEAVMGTNPAHFKDKPDSPLRPVENVSWSDANEFCTRLSEKTDRAYRLPSEAEWEYACREMTSPPVPFLAEEGSKKIYPPFHFGETITTDLANYDGRSIYGKGTKGEYRQETTPVGYFDVANAFGLYDMHGNVREWCADNWHDNYEGAPTDGSAWLKGGNENRHPLRGGSWIDDPHYCRSACRINNLFGSRYYDYFDDRGFNLGFRVCCSPKD